MSAAIDDDPRPIPPVQLDLPTIVRVLFWISGGLTVVVGLVFVGTEFGTQTPCSNDGCIGPSLRWGSAPFTVDRDLNANWRAVFSLQPSQLVEIWTPVFFGIISITAHFPGFQYSWLTKNWFHLACWNIFLALFGHLGTRLLSWRDGCTAELTLSDNRIWRKSWGHVWHLC